MITIIKEEKEAKTYIQAIKKLFEVYRISKRFNMEEKITNSGFKHLVDSAVRDSEYEITTIKGKILKENLLGDKTLTTIAEETMYSVAHVYGIKQKLLKEFATMTFGVIILWDILK